MSDIKPGDRVTPENAADHPRNVRWSDYDRTTGRYYAAGGMTAPEREAVVKAFAGAGWNVKFWGDQRDGDALVFHPRNVR